MKKILISLFLWQVLSVSAVPNFDPFANAMATGGTGYDVGSNLVGQNSSGLFSAWYARGANSGNSTQPIIATNSLSYPDLPLSSGNSVSFVPANAMSACLDLNLAAQQTNTVYYSFLLKITDLTSVSTAAANNPFVIFIDDPAPQNGQIARRGSRLLTRKVGSGYVLGTSKSDTVADYIYEPDAAAHNIGDVLFVAGSYQKVGTATNVNLWVNPSSSSFGSNAPPIPTLVAPASTTPTGALNNNGARAFGILCQFIGAPTGIIDELRLGTNWVSVTGGDPAIFQNPANQTAPPGGNASFTVGARGSQPLSYQWIKDGTIVLADGGNISGANTAILSISNISPGNLGSYSVVVTNSLGAFVPSASATLTFSDPSITAQPQNRTNTFGTTATFQVMVSGTGPFTYQWRKLGVGDLSDTGNISGSHSNSLTISNVTFPDMGSYSVIVTGAMGQVTSAAATLTVRDPAITTQPGSATNVAGTSVSFHVVAIGSAPLTYQWKKNGVNLSDGGNITGATNDTLNLATVSAADEASYTVTVTGGFASSETSINASLTVLTPPVITVQPNPRTVVAGSRVVFVVGASGTSPLFYQWQRGGATIPGATSLAYVITNAQAGDAGSYSVVVSNFLNTATSSSAALTVAPNVQLSQTNIIVIRLGDGAQGLSLTGNSMYLDQFATSGSYVNTVSIPEDGTGGIIAIGTPNVQGTTGNITGSGLTRSVDRRLMVVAGYNTNLNYGASLGSATSSAVPRGVGVINAQGQYSLAVSSTATIFSQGAFRAAVTDGTNDYFGCANKGGVYYFGFTAPEGAISSLIGNIRSMSTFNGNIYFAAAVAGSDGIYRIDGLPTSGAPATQLFPNGTGTADMEVSPDGNLIYVADDRSSATGGGVLRYQFDGTSWTLAYALTGGLPSGARSVTADFSGPNPIVCAVTPESENNRIVRIVDTGVASTGATLANAGVNQVFRGLRFGPIGAVTQPVLSVARDGNNVILSWSGAFNLQSSTNVAGTYSTLVGATSPYTNNVSSANQLFFRLKD